MNSTIKAVLLGSALSMGALTASGGEVRMMWYSDGVEGEVMQDLLNRFMEANPDIKVTLDNVAYKVIKEQLPIQLAAGEGPDIARMTDIKALSEHFMDLTPYLADADAWKANFGAHLDWMRPDGTNIIPGFMTQLTLTGGFANKTLFDQAGVEMPGEGATWSDWVDAAGEVMASQQTPAAIAIDRSGHRITGPMISYGTKFIGEDGAPAPLDDGAKAFITDLVGWTESGKNYKDVWVSAAGATYRAAAEDFINAMIPFYYSGSWQIANLSTKIGDGFDWVATGSPCGEAACSGLAGGAALVGIKYTKNPEDVAKVMEFLGQEEIVREFSERTLFLPAHQGVVEKGGLNFDTEDANAAAALNTFVAAAGQLADEAKKIPAWGPASDVYGALAQRIGETMAGELSLEDAFARIDSDVAEAVANKATK